MSKFKITPKLIFFILWMLFLVFIVWWLFSLDIPLAEYPTTITETVRAFGLLAPVIFISLYAIRPAVFFPASILSLSAGAIFGPTRAVLILIIAENISALVSYTLGKYFAKDLLDKADERSKLIHKFEKYFHENEFITILILRLIYAPFDLVGYFAGASNISYKSFALATFIGIIPGLITAAFLGGAIHSPVNLLISGAFFILGLIISKLIKQYYSPSTKHDEKRD